MELARVSQFNIPLENPRHLDFEMDIEPSEEIRGDISYVMSAGITGLFFFPYAFMEAIQHFSLAKKIKDDWATTENLIRLCNIPLGFIQSLKSLIFFTLKILDKAISLLVVSLMTAFHVVFVAIESLLEIARLVILKNYENSIHAKEILELLQDLDIENTTERVQYQLSLEKHRSFIVEHLGVEGAALINNINEAIDNRELELPPLAHLGSLGPSEPSYLLNSGKVLAALDSQENPSPFQERVLQLRVNALISRFLLIVLDDFAKEQLGIFFLGNEGNLDENPEIRNIQLNRRNGLARVIRPIFVHELTDDIPRVLHHLSQRGEIKDGIKLAKRIYRKLDEQIEKTKKVYAMGMIALAIAAIGIFVSGYCIPAAIVLGIIGTVIEFARYFAPQSYLDQQGEKWSWEYWIPSRLKNAFGPTEIELQVL